MANQRALIMKAEGERRFLDRASSAGVTVFGDYEGALVRVDCRCPRGHACAPMPARVQQGGSWCKTCKEVTALHIEANFRNLAMDVGMEIVGLWSGVNGTIAAVCPSGHACLVRPNDIRRWSNWCSQCTGRATSVALRRHRAAAAAAGVRLVGKWAGVHAPMDAICPVGHACDPAPSVIRDGQGWCKTCAQRDTRAAEASHRARAVAAGVVLTGPWRGALVAMEGLCPEGHACRAVPANITTGQGWCSECLVAMDRVYLVEHPSRPLFKIGIASSPVRLGKHLRRGWLRPQQWLGLENAHARRIEREVITAFRSAGIAHALKEEVPYGDGHTETFSIERMDMAIGLIRSSLSRRKRTDGTMATTSMPYMVSDQPLAVDAPRLTAK